MKKINRQQLSKHCTRQDFWISINDKVYNLTNFLDLHPGGDNIFLYGGNDASKVFFSMHNEDVIYNVLDKKYLVGTLYSEKEDTYQSELKQIQDTKSQTQKRHIESVTDQLQQQSQQQQSQNKPLIQLADLQVQNMINLSDFEQMAKKKLSKGAFSYYSSGSNDEITLRENLMAYQRVWLIPRILVNVSFVSTHTKLIQGTASSAFPLYITATAMAKMANQEGEFAIIKAAHAQKVLYMVPTLASCKISEIFAHKHKDQDVFFQLIQISGNREITKELVRQAEGAGAKALVLTADTPQLGRREKDLRAQMLLNLAKQNLSIEQLQLASTKDDNDKPSVVGSLDSTRGIATGLTTYFDPMLDWDYLLWLKQLTRLPVVLKGVQSKEDAVLAYEHGMAAIILSNHGGRQVDSSRSSIEILPEIMAELHRINPQMQMEVFIDGGVRRGSDIFKALALGAKAVGIGRPIIYGLGCFGQQGVEKVLELLLQEFQLCMRLMGVTAIEQINQSLVDARDLSVHAYSAFSKL